MSSEQHCWPVGQSRSDVHSNCAPGQAAFAGMQLALPSTSQHCSSARQSELRTQRNSYVQVRGSTSQLATPVVAEMQQ